MRRLDPASRARMPELLFRPSEFLIGQWTPSLHAFILAPSVGIGIWCAQYLSLIAGALSISNRKKAFSSVGFHSGSDRSPKSQRFLRGPVQPPMGGQSDESHQHLTKSAKAFYTSSVMFVLLSSSCPSSLSYLLSAAALAGFEGAL